MLILTRRTQEAIMIGNNVTVTVLNVNGNQVRLGIDAPKEVQVHREEIYHKVNSGIPYPEKPAVTDSDKPSTGNKTKTKVIRKKANPEDETWGNR